MPTTTERVITSSPVDKQASLVMGKATDPGPSKVRQRAKFDTPPPCLPIPNSQNFTDFTGAKIGQLTVVGYLGSQPHTKASRAKGARWLVQCSCKTYEYRSTKSLRGENTTEEPACWDCQYLNHLRERSR